MVFERVVEAADEEPKRPEKLEAELEHEVGDHDEQPGAQELQVEERAARVHAFAELVLAKVKLLSVFVALNISPLHS